MIMTERNEIQVDREEASAWNTTEYLDGVEKTEENTNNKQAMYRRQRGGASHTNELHCYKMKRLIDVYSSSMN